jgi:hypothetical protein
LNTDDAAGDSYINFAKLSGSYESVGTAGTSEKLQRFAEQSVSRQYVGSA